MTAIFFYFKLWNILLCQVMKWTFYLLGFTNKKNKRTRIWSRFETLKTQISYKQPLKTLEPNLNNLNLIVTVWIVLTLRENSCANTSLSHLTCITRRLVFTSKVRATLLAPKKNSNLREEQKRGAPCAFRFLHQPTICKSMFLFYSLVWLWIHFLYSAFYTVIPSP